MKRLKVLLLIAIMLTIGGCIEQTEQNHYERLTEAVNAGIGVQQESTHKIIETLRESNTISEEKLSKIETQVDKADEYVEIAKTAAMEAAKIYDERQSEDKTIAFIEAAREANRISTPVNPYAPLIDAGLGIAAAIAGGYGLIKRKETNTTNEELTTVNQKYDAHKKAVETLMIESTPEAAKKIYDLVGAERAKIL